MNRRVLGASVSVIALVVMTSGCTGSKDSGIKPFDSSSTTKSASPSPSASPSTSFPTPTPTPTPTVSPTPTATLQAATSKFESKPQVKVARTWAAAVAKSINDGKKDLGGARKLMTAHGKQVVPPLFSNEFGRFYPGPVPFTPTAVKTQGKTASVNVCLQTAGFSRVKNSNFADAKRISAARLTFVKSGSSWRIDELQTRAGSCGGVKVEQLADPSFGPKPQPTPAPSGPKPTPSAGVIPSPR